MKLSQGQKPIGVSDMCWLPGFTCLIINACMSMRANEPVSLRRCNPIMLFEVDPRALTAPAQPPCVNPRPHQPLCCYPASTRNYCSEHCPHKAVQVVVGDDGSPALFLTAVSSLTCHLLWGSGTVWGAEGVLCAGLLLRVWLCFGGGGFSVPVGGLGSVQGQTSKLLPTWILTLVSTEQDLQNGDGWRNPTQHTSNTFLGRSMSLPRKSLHPSAQYGTVNCESRAC